MESLCMLVSSKSTQTQLIIQYTFEGFLSPFILSALPKETGYINTPYGKWNQSQHHIVFLSYAISQYDMLKFFADEHCNS